MWNSFKCTLDPAWRAPKDGKAKDLEEFGWECWLVLISSTPLRGRFEDYLYLHFNIVYYVKVDGG